MTDLNSNVGSPQSVLGVEYALHLEQMETLSRQYDIFDGGDVNEYIDNPVESLSQTWDFSDIMVAFVGAAVMRGCNFVNEV